MSTTPYYPGRLIDFGPEKVNYTDIVDASHPNIIQAEVYAIETTLGINPATSTSPASTDSWTPGLVSATVSARMANIEKGLVGDTHTQYVKKTGSTLTGTLTFSGGAKVTGLPTPTASSDAVTKSYVDTLTGASAGSIYNTALAASVLLMGA